MTETAHGDEKPSAWVSRWSHLIRKSGSVLDVACGHGRHARWFAELGHPVVAIDKSADAIEAVRARAPGVEALVADIEEGPWPFAADAADASSPEAPTRLFDAVVVTNYLWRPLLPTLLASLAPGGALLYETFAQGNETVGKPSRPDFLLRPGELLEVCGVLRIVAFEDGFEDRFEEPDTASRPRFVQRVAAVRESRLNAGLPGSAQAGVYSPPRYGLT